MQRKSYKLDNPFIDGAPIKVTIARIDKVDKYDGKQGVNVHFSMGNEKMAIKQIYCSPLHAWDNLDTVCAAIDFIRAAFEEADGRRREGGITLNYAFQDVFECLNTESADSLAESLIR